MLEAESPGLRSLGFGCAASVLFCGCILGLLGVGKTRALVPVSGFRLIPGSSDTVPAPPAVVTISWLPAKPVSGGSVAITVRVRSDGGPSPIGRVRIYDGVTVLGLSELQDGSVTVTGRLPETPGHLLRATYLGDAYHYAVSSVVAKE